MRKTRDKVVSPIVNLIIVIAVHKKNHQSQARYRHLDDLQTQETCRIWHLSCFKLIGTAHEHHTVPFCWPQYIAISIDSAYIL